jgi:HSP20 family protein
MAVYLQTYPGSRMAARMVRRWAEQPRNLAVNVREEEDAYILYALVPGLNPEDLNIQVLEDVLHIEGEYKADDSQYVLRELPQGKFERTLRLPTAIQADKIEANINDGVLELRLPKAEYAKPKKIKVIAK